MLGLLLAVAAPVFIVPAADSRSDLAAVVAAARRTAVLRAEPVTLSVDDAGVWVLGACVPETTPDPATQDWSAVGCGPHPAREVPRS